MKIKKFRVLGKRVDELWKIHLPEECDLHEMKEAKGGALLAVTRDYFEVQYSSWSQKTAYVGFQNIFFVWQEAKTHWCHIKVQEDVYSWFRKYIYLSEKCLSNGTRRFSISCKIPQKSCKRLFLIYTGNTVKNAYTFWTPTRRVTSIKKNSIKTCGPSTF